VGDRGDLGRVVGEGPLERREEVLGLDRLERRVSNGVCQGSRSGFSCVFEEAAFALVSDIAKSRFRRKFTRESIARDAAFLRLLRL
jgi:hypothetical protein